jgi:hypothetical protein
MSTDSQTEFRPLGLALGVLIPGAGHIAAGQKRRGVWVGIGVLGLFFGGMLVGGIDVIDSKEDRVWFLGQALVGPIAFGVDYLHQNRFKVVDQRTGARRSAYPNEGRDPATGAPVPGGTPPNEKSIAKVNELGTLFATIAGMLNLIAIIDAGFPTIRRRRGPAAPAQPATPGAKP